MDALTPAEITDKADEVWYKKANGKISHTLISGILAGMYIAFWAFFSVTSISGLSGSVPFWIIKVIAWLSFSLGLILVMLAGAELFTWNTLLIVALLNKKITIWKTIKNLILIWSSNFIWALIVVGLLYFWWWHLLWNSVVGDTLVNIGIHKLEYWFFQAFVLGILCNILVCLWVWLAWSWRSTADKVLWIIFPITAFVAAWFEHSVANMFYLPFVYLLKISGFIWSWVNLDVVNLSQIFVHNLLPVTLWNLVWWAVFVGMAYWFLYNKK